MPEHASVAPQPLLGRLAVEQGMLNQAQLDQVLRIHAQLQGTQPLGALFVQRGLLTLGQVQELLRLQRQIEQQRLNAGAVAPPALAAGKPLQGTVRQGGPAPNAAGGAGAPNPFLQAPRAAAFDAPGKPGQAAPNPAAAPAPTAKGGPRMVLGRTSPGPAVAAAPARPEPIDFDDLLVPADETEPPPAPPPARAAPAAPAPAAKAAASRKTSTQEAPVKPGKVKAGTLVARIVEDAEKRGASDVHFHASLPTVLRMHGRLVVMEQPPVDAKEQEKELLSILTDEQRTIFDDTGDLDFAYVTPSNIRMRANFYRSLAGVDATFRLVPREPQSLEDLQLPSAVARLTAYHQGLVLVTGPAGCGKSTTLAALINMLNEERTEHILTLEDPIEIVHPPKRALVNQRQIGRDTESFARALRGALREDPDIIMIGDLRDRETISLAITAAETGHLVIGSMNTSNAGRTVGRLIDAFPPTQQSQVRAMLSESLRGVISQRLVPGVAGKRIPAIELLIVTPAIGNLIREGKLFQIRSQMQVGKHIGMRTLDESLKDLVAAGMIEASEAKLVAENPAQIADPNAKDAAAAPAAAAAAPGRPGAPQKPAAPVAGRPIGARPGTR
jgi:twitching motility protein PilT